MLPALRANRFYICVPISAHEWFWFCMADVPFSAIYIHQIDLGYTMGMLYTLLAFRVDTQLPTCKNTSNECLNSGVENQRDDDLYENVI